MPIEIWAGGNHYPRGTLKRGMLFVVREALVAGIAPAQLKLHVGTTNERNRWLDPAGHVSAQVALAAAVASKRRVFGAANEVLSFGSRFFVLTDQWSWDTLSGSSKDDLERIVTNLPQLKLRWQWWP